jgi:hypothetical protein
MYSTVYDFRAQAARPEARKISSLTGLLRTGTKSLDES